MAEPHTPNESAFGVLRIKAGPDGGAVRLGVLVRDLMKRHDMARAEAVTDLLLPRLQGDSPPALYLLQPGGNALALGDREWFQTGTGDAAWSIGAGSTIWNVKREPADSLGHGTAGAVAWLRLVWASPKYADAGMDVREALGSFLAVSEADAAAMWGWGAARVVELRVVGVIETEATAPAQQEWGGAALWARRGDLIGKQVKAPTKALAELSGLSEREVTRRMKPFRDNDTNAVQANGTGTNLQTVWSVKATGGKTKQR